MPESVLSSGMRVNVLVCVCVSHGDSLPRSQVACLKFISGTIFVVVFWVSQPSSQKYFGHIIDFAQ